MAKKTKEENEEKEEFEEQIQLSKLTNFLVCLIMCLAVFGRFPPLAQGILFGFMPLVITFDVVRQRSARKEGK